MSKSEISEAPYTMDKIINDLKHFRWNNQKSLKHIGEKHSDYIIAWLDDNLIVPDREAKLVNNTSENLLPILKRLVSYCDEMEYDFDKKGKEHSTIKQFAKFFTAAMKLVGAHIKGDKEEIANAEKSYKQSKYDLSKENQYVSQQAAKNLKTSLEKATNAVAKIKSPPLPPPLSYDSGLIPPALLPPGGKSGGGRKR